MNIHHTNPPPLSSSSNKKIVVSFLVYASNGTVYDSSQVRANVLSYLASDSIKPVLKGEVEEYSFYLSLLSSKMLKKPSKPVVPTNVRVSYWVVYIVYPIYRERI